LARNIVEDVSVILCCGMQLRGTPTERELKEKMNRKIKMERKRKLELGIEVPSAA
jgi:hypothetical protein